MTTAPAEATLDTLLRHDILPRLIGAPADPLARIAATELIASGKDKNLPPLLRSLLFIPLLDSDQPIDRERAVALFAGLRRETQEAVFEQVYAYALRQRDRIADGR